MQLFRIHEIVHSKEKIEKHVLKKSNIFWRQSFYLLFLSFFFLPDNFHFIDFLFSTLKFSIFQLKALVKHFMKKKFLAQQYMRSPLAELLMTTGQQTLHQLTLPWKVPHIM